MLGTRIKELRKEFGLSQVELAAQMEVTKQTISNWENENIQPSIDMLVGLANVFNVTTDYLLTGIPAPDQEEALRKMLLNRITTADRRLEKRSDRPFSRQELAVLFAAMLMEP